jgi:hypothetical protein
MAYKTSELKQIIRHALITDSTVFGLVDIRIATAHRKDADAPTATMPEIIVGFRGGQEFGSSPVARRTFFLYGYSNRSQSEAEEVYEAAADVLRRTGHGAPPNEAGDPCFEACGYFIPQGQPLEGWNPVAEAWFTRGSWLGWQKG